MNKGAFPYSLTVFTATYNRADLLQRVYQSLKAQTFKDFEWVIVDDGSTDQTKELVRTWMEKPDFPIRYVWQPNSGLHAAFNRGVRMARGYLFATLDSDDWYVAVALERYVHYWESVPDQRKSGFSGVVGLSADPSGEVIGTRFPQNVLDSDAVEIRVRYRVKGDKVPAHRTQVLREIPFPEGLGRYVTPALVWNRIALRYRTRYFNEVVAYKDYQTGGISDKSVVVRATSPRAARLYYQEFINMGQPLPIDIALRNYANYVRYSLHVGADLKEQVRRAPSRLLWATSFPLGAGLHLRDKAVLRRRRPT